MTVFSVSIDDPVHLAAIDYSCAKYNAAQAAPRCRVHGDAPKPLSAEQYVEHVMQAAAASWADEKMDEDIAAAITAARAGDTGPVKELLAILEAAAAAAAAVAQVAEMSAKA